VQADECSTVIRSSVKLEILKGTVARLQQSQYVPVSSSEEFDNAHDKHLTVGHFRFEADGADSAGLYFRSLNVIFSWDHRTF
jgi:hypothetical protein